MVDGPIRVFENKFKRKKSEVSSNMVSPDSVPENVISPERSRPLKSKRAVTPDSLKISSSQTKSQDNLKKVQQEFRFSQEQPEFLNYDVGMSNERFNMP